MWLGLDSAASAVFGVVPYVTPRNPHAETGIRRRHIAAPPVSATSPREEERGMRVNNHPRKWLSPATYFGLQVQKSTEIYRDLESTELRQSPIRFKQVPT